MQLRDKSLMAKTKTRIVSQASEIDAVVEAPLPEDDADRDALDRAGALAEAVEIFSTQESALAPGILAAAIDRAAKKPRASFGSVNLDGARRSAAAVARLARDKTS